MVGPEMAEEYYSYLLNTINADEYGKDYKTVLRMLFETEFYWTVDNDENRASDGLDLRDEFAYERQIDYDFWVGYLPEACSMLEMMVALAKRMEIEIMHDPDLGDRTPLWFWTMFNNLGLENETDLAFCDTFLSHCDTFRKKTVTFCDRKYEKNGRGSLFFTKNPALNMPKIEIWYQMQYFLGENY